VGEILILDALVFVRCGRRAVEAHGANANRDCSPINPIGSSRSCEFCASMPADPVSSSELAEGRELVEISNQRDRKTCKNISDIEQR
jgi:hypothetical protein